MNKKILLLAVPMVLGLSSCNLDINDNPNYPSSSNTTSNLLFPAVENAIADCVGDQMFTYGGFFAQYFEQRPEQNQYNDLAELNIDESTSIFDRCYSLLYAGAMEDIAEIKSRTDITAADNFAATVMRVQAYQLMVDNTSDAPYTEALQGSSVPSPKWDDGATVYRGVLDELDAAEASISGTASMTLNDPIFGGDLSKWEQYANALRLRMYLRLIDGGVDAATYKAKVQALVAENNLPTEDVTYSVYSNAEDQYNPWYGATYKLKTNNFCASYPIVSYMNSTNDPRISYGMLPNTKESKYLGQIPGAKTQYKGWGEKTWLNENVSTINLTPSIAMPVYLFTVAEIDFLKAEVELRFNNNASAAKADYEAGVRADFTSRGVSGADTFLANPSVNIDSKQTTEDKLKLIYMQKWVALFYRDHMEAWSEARRTDIPAQSSLSAKDVYDGKPYVAGDFIAPAINYRGNGGLCKRMPYPSTARKYNTNTPAVKAITDRVFWDVK